MKFRKNARALLILLLTLCMVLPACSNGIADPIDDSSLLTEGTGFSENEALALFGKEAGEHTGMFDGPFLYYKGKLYPNSDNGKLTVYRYNIETGESEYACQDTVCTHDKNSGCPFAYLDYFGQVVVADGKVIYTTEPQDENPGHPLEWYDPQTGEHGVLAIDADNRFVVGGSLYFDRGEPVADIEGDELEPVLLRELWKYDFAQNKAIRVASTKDKNDSTPEAVLYHGEERVVISSHNAYDGGVDAEKVYYYWVDPETGARTPMTKEGFSGGGEGWFLGDYYLYGEPNGEGGHIMCSLNLETGEKKIVSEEGLNLTVVFPTEKYLLSVFKDPEGKATRILRLYDPTTGEWLEEEYPLYGEYTGLFLRYYRGKLYFLASLKGNRDPITGELPETGGYLQWDILTGEQRMIPYSIGLL